MKFGIVSRITDGCFRYQAWPTIAKGEDGTLYAASSGHRLGHVCPFGKNLMVTSNDEGKTWSCPQIINDTWCDDRDAGLVAWGESNLMLSWFNHPTSLYEERALTKKNGSILTSPLATAMRELWKGLDSTQYRPGSWVRISRDNGKTWEDQVQVPVTAPHGPIRKKDGSFFYVGRAFQWEGLEDGIYAYESLDDGKTWQFVSKLPVPEGMEDHLSCEPYSIELENGEVMAAVRIQHASNPRNFKIYTTFSKDGGKNWERANLLDLCGAPPHMLKHSSGALIMVYGRRMDPMGQYALVSYDNGRTWGEDFIVSPPAPDWDQGYPSSVELSDGEILTIYYQKFPGDTHNSILYTRWSLPERP